MLGKKIEKIRHRITAKIELWEQSWEDVPPQLKEPCCCKYYGTKYCPLTRPNEVKVDWNLDDDGNVLSVLELLPPQLRICLRYYKVVEHVTIETVRIAENLDANTKWHICYGEVILGNSSPGNKTIDLFWFNHFWGDRDTRIQKKIHTLIHELHHAFQHLYQTNRYNEDRAKYHRTSATEFKNWIEDDADQAANKFLSDNSASLERMFNIKIDNYLLDHIESNIR